MQREQQLAWVAGLIDGDGCFSITKKRSYHDYYVSISSLHRPTLEVARDILGYGTLIEDGRYHKLSIFGQAVPEIAVVLEPYLLTKKSQAQLVVQFFGLPRVGKGKRCIPPEIMAARDHIVGLLKDHKAALGTLDLGASGNTSPTEIPWLAGLVDAEGSISLIRDGRKHQLAVQLSMGHKLSVYRAFAIAGVGGVTVHQRGHRRPSWSFHCKSSSAEHLLRLVIPYLVTKKRQAELGLAFRSLPKAPPGFALPEDLLEERESIRQQILELNRST